MNLADQIRPDEYKHVVGHIPIVNILQKGFNQSAIFQGKAGIGKTTLAQILMKKMGLTTYREVGSKLSTDSIRMILQSARLQGPVVLVLDEIQYLNKKQQQLFLDDVENGNLILIATTTESVTSAVHEGLRSRCRVFYLKPPTEDEIVQALTRITGPLNVKVDLRVLKSIASDAQGDVRFAINILEMLLLAGAVDMETYEAVQAKKVSSVTVEEYKSALQKSIRGSDPDAAALYAMALLDNGELEALCRRLRVIVSEDIGIASPNGPAIVEACIENALNLGMPEAAYPIVHAVIWMAIQPKSNSIATAIERFRALEGREIIPPENIRYAHAKSYVYPHSYPNNWVKQNYMPTDLQGLHLYHPGTNKTETAFKEYQKSIKGGKSSD